MTKERRNDKQYLLDICDAIDSINDFLMKKSKKEFYDSYMLQSAVFRQFEIIGEAASRLSSVIAKIDDDIIWKDVVGMRHKMIHDYFEVSVEITWNAAKNDIKPLKSKIKKILKGL
jgi:uncharacterized protein with HEPN domain